MHLILHSNTLVPNDDKLKVLINNKGNHFYTIFENFIPVERALCFDVVSPIAGLIDRILNGRISIEKEFSKKNEFHWIV
jgi:hypothetical protein